MAAVMGRLAVIAALGACGTPSAPRRATPSEPPPLAVMDASVAAAAPDAAPVFDEVAPPAECGKRTWAQCLEAARSLVAQQAWHQEEGVTLYKLLCAEGDRRGCFDGVAGEDRRCVADGVVVACVELAGLYESGLATCPRDETCAGLLYRMACRGGHEEACR